MRRRQKQVIIAEDLIVEILSWSRVKSLIRFKCVCKSFNSLTSDPQFVKLHLQRSSHRRLLFNCGINRTLWSCPLISILENNPSSSEQHQLDTKYLVIGSCNGLTALLRCDFDESTLETQVWSWIRFWNPATRSISQYSPSVYTRRSFINFGFGYDHITDTYKVVTVIYSPIGVGSQRNLVYSIGGNCWRNIPSLPDDLILQATAGNGVYLNGTLNWIAVSQTSHQLVIVSFHLGKETNTGLLMPHGHEHDFKTFNIKQSLTLGVLKDCLSVLFALNGTNFVIWQMKEFGVRESWTCLMNVSHEYLHTHRFYHVHLFTCLFPDRDIFMLLVDCRDTAILYNQRNGILTCFKMPDEVYRAKCYVESMVSPS